jgi:hypothetical protein
MAPLMGQVCFWDLPQRIELNLLRRLLELQLQSGYGYLLLRLEHGIYRALETTTTY